MPKAITSILTLFFPTLHIYFAYCIVQAESFEMSHLVLFLLTLPLLLLGIKSVVRNGVQLRIDYFEILMVVLGAITTYFMNIQLNLGPLISSGIVGIAGSLLIYIDQESRQIRRFQFAIYCGAFVGMSSTLGLQTINELLSAGICSGVIFVLLTNRLNGIGGKHGAIAFAGVLLTNIIIYAV